MKKIKLMHIITHLEIGGAERQALLLLKGLNKERYDAVLVSFSEGPLLKEFKDAGVEVEIIKIKKRFNLSGFISAFIGVFRLINIIREKRPDIIHTHQPISNLLGSAVARILRVPVIVSIIQGSHQQFAFAYRSLNKFKRLVKIKYLLIDKINAMFVTKLIAVSKATRSELVEKVRVNPRKIEVIYNAVDINSFSSVKDNGRLREELGFGFSDRIVGTVANLSPVKGLRFLIEAASLLNKEKEIDSIKFLIVGGRSSQYGFHLKELIRRLGLEEKVIFTGLRTDIADILKILEIFVLPSLSEGLPLSILEAMTMAKPVIATEAGGVPEVVKDNRTGLLVPPGNSAALSSAILQLLKDKEKAIKMGIEGRRLVERQFDLNVIVSKTQELYEKLLKNKKI
jgi:glycosyltransferase involved in cell wall biosynthesis